MSANLASAKLERVRLDCRLTPQDALRAIADEPWPFALTGDWAGGGAVVGSSPLLLADPDADPFALLDALPQVGEHGHRGPTVGGGWFGWLGYRLGRRIEDLPVGPRDPSPFPSFTWRITTTCCTSTLSGNGGSKRWSATVRRTVSLVA
jgi:para-aminobenzoate synthetase/4-amino-4-deoxychorismate lyase